MNNFKLIAITPLKGCSDKFSKNLTLGLPYKFYDRYEITVDDRKEKIEKVVKNEHYDFAKDLYALRNGIKVEFSAVAGKNGSGKSTLFEMFYYLIYFMATTYKDDDDKPFLSKAFTHLEEQKEKIQSKRNNLIIAAEIHEWESLTHEITEPIKDLDLYTLDLILEFDLDVNTSRADSMLGIYKVVSGGLNSLISDLDAEIKREKKQHSILEKEFNVSVLYERDGRLWEACCTEGNIRHYFFDDQAPFSKRELYAFTFDVFFYTISLNYSHHSLNSKALGSWISKLFHKNDAYRTPVVINPMRTNGNFDINDELELSKERLISTLAYDLTSYRSGNLILDKYKVSKYIFTPKRGLGDYELDALTLNIIKEKTSIESNFEDIPYGGLAISYLNKKINKIRETYNYLISEGDDDKPSLEEFLLDDTSHLTRKINQTLNYLRESQKEEHKKIWGKTDGISQIELDPDEFKNYLDLFFGEIMKRGPEDIIKFALPGFFNIDFEFTDINERKIKLSDLSSGEQQMVFNINAILYHLYNIQSVHQKQEEPKRSKDGESATAEVEREHQRRIAKSKRLTFSHVNIVLDEIELYYHPEMQRALVQNLINSFENLQDSSGIKAINVCILTHSPFILSDIPALNVLLLERNKDGLSVVKKNQSESFAANINDLMADNFFLDDTLVGDFAAKKIEEFIDRVKKKHRPAGESDFIGLIGDPYLKSIIATLSSEND